jgi:hypothetical protein
MPKKRRYIVVPRTENVKQTGITTGKGKLTFGKKTAQWVDDPVIADEIDKTHGLKGSGDVWVHQDENLEWHEQNEGLTDGRTLGIHHYTFAQAGVVLPDRKKLLKKTKTIGGVKYRYIEQDGKMKLVPAGTESSKREKLHKKISKASATPQA